jgi:hypothetical protein
MVMEDGSLSDTTLAWTGTACHYSADWLVTCCLTSASRLSQFTMLVGLGLSPWHLHCSFVSQARLTAASRERWRRSGGDTCKQPVVVRNMVNAHTL